MKNLPKLEELSVEARDVLIYRLWEKIPRLEQEVAKLREKLEQKGVKKTSANSSLPPSQGFKPEIKLEKGAKKKRQAHQNGGRGLEQEPNQIIIAKANICPHCQARVEPEDQKLLGVDEKVEIPKIEPIVTQIQRYGGQCPNCQSSYDAPVPVGMEQGSPFGKSIESLVTYLRYSHAISYERMSQLMSEVFGVKISEGGLAESRSLRSQSKIDNSVSFNSDSIRRY